MLALQLASDPDLIPTVKVLGVRELTAKDIVQKLSGMYTLPGHTVDTPSCRQHLHYIYTYGAQLQASARGFPLPVYCNDDSSGSARAEQDEMPSHSGGYVAGDKLWLPLASEHSEVQVTLEELGMRFVDLKVSGVRTDGDSS